MARARCCVVPGGPRLLAGSGFEGLFVFVGTQGMFLYVHMADLAKTAAFTQEAPVASLA